MCMHHLYELSLCECHREVCRSAVCFSPELTYGGNRCFHNAVSKCSLAHRYQGKICESYIGAAGIFRAGKVEVLSSVITPTRVAVGLQFKRGRFARLIVENTYVRHRHWVWIERSAKCWRG